MDCSRQSSKENTTSGLVVTVARAVSQLSSVSPGQFKQNPFNGLCTAITHHADLASARSGRRRREAKEGRSEGWKGGWQAVGRSVMFEPEPAETTNTAISIYFLLPYLRENKTEVKLQVGK